VADRAEWIDFNIGGFGALLEPILERATKTADNVTWAFGTAALTAQVGLLLGFLSARVLGQYDTGPLVAGRKGSARKPGEPGEIFFLDGNIVAAAGRLGVPVDGLRLWIVLHETTHALQFEGHPWLRDHLAGLVERFTAPLAERLGVGETLRRLAGNFKTGARTLELVMTPDQRRIFDTLQATMSVIEATPTTSCTTSARASSPATRTSRKGCRGAGRTGPRWRPPSSASPASTRSSSSTAWARSSPTPS
jgi:coenzyme F420 biosynthesis associated uncharacterized protein